MQTSIRPKVLLVLVVATLLAACGGSKPPESPQFEMRDFVVSEEKTEPTQYSKGWNSFKGAGTLVARNIDKDRNLIGILEIRDGTKGPSAEPEVGSILVRGGLGKIKIEKSKYGEVSQPPKYVWSVIGWYELHKASIEVPGQASK